MGVVSETILAAKSLGSTDFEDLTPGTDDVFTIRDFVQGSRAYIEEIWGLDDTAVCLFSLASKRMNDGQEGLQIAVPSGAAIGPAEEPQVLLPGPGKIPVYGADTLKVRAKGSSGDNCVFAFTVRYDNLEGSDVNFATWGEIAPQIEKTFGILIQPTNGKLDYGTPVALDSADDRLESGKRYAWLGATSDLPTALLACQGPDTGRYNVGMPLKNDPVDGFDYFVRQSAKYQLPAIPVIKANNKATTLFSTVDANTAASPNITLLLAQLAT